jgi:XTP/dITP diphosphohydrolase
LAEIRAMLGEGVDCVSMDELGDVPELVELADSFEGNARSKAEQLAIWIEERGGLREGWVLADDSGLEVDGLGGAPGVRSARFAAEDGYGNASDEANNGKLLRLLEGCEGEGRRARFRCVLALRAIGGAGDGEGARVFEGVCEGFIARVPAGDGGFGYDPLFIPEGQRQSFSELGEEEKNRISHRRKALDALCVWLHKTP